MRKKMTNENNNNWNDQNDGDTAIISRTKPKTKTPDFFRVILLNDDYTPMEFVVLVLQRFFSKNMDEATQIMLQVHKLGSGVAGIFPFEVAESKAYLVNQFSRQNQHPLKCLVEKV
jgi:ATP-dependent Clp protease adaptor protein ClpS